MTRVSRPHALLLLLTLTAFQAPTPLAGQTELSLGLLSTRDLYILGRDKAARINRPCAGDLDVYLDGVAYLYAYHQAASRDGSLRSDPRFAQAFSQQFTEVVDRARRCLKAYGQDASSQSRNDDPSSVQRKTSPPGVPLDPDPPTAGPAPEQVATDVQGRTIPQLVAIIDKFPDERAAYRAEIQRVEQQRDALAAEVARLRSLPSVAPPPPPPPPPAPTPAPAPARLNTEYRVRVKASDLYWYINGDNHLSTRVESNDDYSRFIIEGSGIGGYRIRNKATGRYLYTRPNYLIGSVTVANDGDSVFLLDQQPDGSYRVQARDRNRYLLEDRSTSGLVTALAQPGDDYTRFFFVP